MDVQMIIPILTSDAVDHPVVVSRTSVSPLSYAALQDPNLVKELEPLATLYQLNLSRTFPTSTLLQILMLYQATYRSGKTATIHFNTAKRILEAAWYKDIGEWSETGSLSINDPQTGDIIWSDCLIRYLELILRPLVTRTAYIFLDKKGDISGDSNTTGIWRRCHFDCYKLNHPEKTLELQFRVNNQTKGLILQRNEIMKFEDLGIYFQHPTHPDCVLFSPFCCKEYTEPRLDSVRLRKRIQSEIWMSTAAFAQEKLVNQAKVCFNLTLLPGSSSSLGWV
jgi:hypothetical protein